MAPPSDHILPHLSSPELTRQTNNHNISSTLASTDNPLAEGLAAVPPGSCTTKADRAQKEVALHPGAEHNQHQTTNHPNAQETKQTKDPKT